MERKCCNCKKKFVSKTRKAMYCSKRCGKAFRRKKRVAENKELQAKGLTTGFRTRYHGPLELKTALDEYFNKEDEDEITPAGMLLHLNINRDLWAIYENRPGLSRFCEEAKLRMEHLGTKRLYKKGRVADIFFMKNMGWSDRTEVSSKDHITISENVSDEQAQKIMQRFASRRRLGKGSEK